MRTQTLALCLTVSFCLNACNRPSSIVPPKDPGRTETVASATTAYMLEFDDVNVVTKFRDRANSAHEAPEGYFQSFDPKRVNVADSIRIEFGDDFVAGHGDLEIPVFCLLVDVSTVDAGSEFGTEIIQYGIYALWDAKANLMMPLPSSASTVSTEDATAEEALVRTIVSLGISAGRGNEIVASYRQTWFSPGMRAFLLTKIPVNGGEKPTIYCFECLGDSS